MGAVRKAILISGGSGLIGRHLSRSLAAKGYDIKLLSRHPTEKSEFATYEWSIEKGYVDPMAFKDVVVVINLAGASIASRRWSKSRKRVLSSSRIGGNQLLYRAIKENVGSIDQFIGASAIGFYGNSGDKIHDEESPLGMGYVSELCAQWEESQLEFREISKQVATVRIGLVLSNEGGVLSSLRKSMVAGIGTVLGSGEQYMSWIHIDDLVEIFLQLIDNPKLNGVVNGVAPQPIKHRDFMRQLVNRKGGFRWLVPIPKFLIRNLMGERSSLVLEGARVLPKFMQLHGFEFKYKDLPAALDNLMLT